MNKKKRMNSHNQKKDAALSQDLSKYCLMVEQNYFLS